MESTDLEREIGRVVRRVLPLVPKRGKTGKKEFERILAEIMQCLHENTKTDLDLIAEKTDQVIRDMPNEYGVLPEKQRSWYALIAYLYMKYLKELELL